MSNIFIHIISKKQASLLGLTRYFDGVPCFKGHVSERRISGDCCVQCKEESKSERHEKKKKAKRVKPILTDEQKQKRLEAKRLYNAKWRKENPESKRADNARRRANKLRAGGKILMEHIKNMFIEQNGVCKCFPRSLFVDGKKSYHVDHIMPLCLGGENSKENMQLLCPGCNMRKGGKHPDVWQKEIEMLYNGK